MRCGDEGRPVADEGDARACLAAVDASGLPLRTWAVANGVGSHSLYRWRQIVAGLDGCGIADEGHARELLVAWAASGESFAGWCRTMRVSAQELRQWRSRRVGGSRVGPPRQPPPARVAVQSAQLPAIRLVELATTSIAVEAAMETPVEAPGVARYEVSVGRCRVMVSTDFDDTVLARLLRVAAAC